MAHAIDHADNLNRYLLGDIYQGPGLLRRVGVKVAELTRVGGPGFVSASVMGAGSQKHDSDPTEDAERVIDLAVALYEWRDSAIGEDTPRVRRMLIDYLRRHRISDTELLLGSANTGLGVLEIIRKEVRQALEQTPYPSGDQVERCFALALHLRDWLGDKCDHDFQLIASDDARIRVMVCAHDCGVRYALDERSESWLAV